ncbi:AAA-4 domain protein [Giardia lamblia P15]|uniref:AAA-4 domain protein n=1 Tax=Giardia intestinalis (strain P15) TaxID=658858 RepID=E1F6W0_GIAIA|nr:AAA-4 domain protein [Giardia lamblia P15]
MDLPPLPETLQYGSWIGFTESIRVEFKALQETNQPLRKVIGNYCREYLNAFLNTYGGCLLFGVDDRGYVQGIFLPNSERDKVLLAIDNSLNQMRPQPGGVIQKIALIPVTDGSTIITNKKRVGKYVVAIHISQGKASVYFTSATSQSAYLRQAASNVKMLPETIIQKLNCENQASFLVDSYDPFKLRHSPEDSNPDLVNYYIRRQNVEFISRQELLSTSINFLRADTQKCRTNVLILYGSETIGSKILDDLSQSIANDRKTFPTIYGVCSLDLRGSTDRHWRTKGRRRTAVLRPSARTLRGRPRRERSPLPPPRPATRGGSSVCTPCPPRSAYAPSLPPWPLLRPDGRLS